MRVWLLQGYLWACQRLYAELAWSYDAVSWLISLGQWSSWRRIALAYLPSRQHPNSVAPLLEIGFGTGALLIELAKRSIVTYGLELSPSMQAIAATKLQRLCLHVPQVSGQAQALPFASETFAAVISTFPANYIMEIATLTEVKRVLRSPDLQLAYSHGGGRLIIVGLWVAINQPWLAALCPVFYGQPTAAALLHYQERLHQTGFQTELKTHHAGLFSVGVIVAHKR